jgi:hypothetical protein
VLSSRRHRELDTKPDPGHRSTLGIGRRRQVDFRSCRSGGKGVIFRFGAARHPRGDCEERRRVFPIGFSHHVEEFSSSHIFTIISTASAEESQSRHNRGSRPPVGGDRTGFEEVDRGCTSTGTILVGVS